MPMTWTDSLFLLAYVTPLLAGLSFLSSRAFSDLGPAARLAGGFALGSLLLAWWATTLSVLGIAWSTASIAIPLLLAALVGVWRAGRSGASTPLGGRRTAGELTAWLVIGSAALYLALELLASGATSIDLFYFWGVKAIHFLLSRGLDASALSWRYALHAHSNYPPLVPVTFVWAALLCGHFSWWGAVLSSGLWWAATIPLVAALLRPRLDRRTSLAVAAFWAVALALSLATSRSGGNAEAPLLLFVTVAGAALLGETADSTPARRWVAAFALAGAVLSKNEGMIEAVLLVAAGLATDLTHRHPRAWRRLAVLSIPPLAAYAPWLLFELFHDLPLSDPARESLFPVLLGHWSQVGSAGLRHLGAGSWGLAWILPALAVILAARRLSWDRFHAALPGLLFIAGMFAFFAFYYLHFSGDPSRLIAWTLPRISQPVLSLWILTAACLSAPGVDTQWQL